MKRCEYKTEYGFNDNDLIYDEKLQDITVKKGAKYDYRLKHCRKLGRYGINGTYYCYEHSKLIEEGHLESIRR